MIKVTPYLAEVRQDWVEGMVWYGMVWYGMGYGDPIPGRERVEDKDDDDKDANEDKT